MSPARKTGVCLALAASLCACGSSSPSEGSSASFPASPLSTIPSDGSKLQVAIYTAPYQPLVAGVGEVQLVVTDPSTGAPMDGLAITMTPWMTAMGHGASVTPIVSALGKGKYVFTNVSLFMPGEWQLRIKFSGEVEDSVEPTFNVE